MARVLAIVDRPPDDADWKGAAAWKLIHSLSESQHEVRVVTTLSPQSVVLSHPRMTVTQPVGNWQAIGMPRLMQAIWSYQPEIIHTFALKPSGLWPALSVWPYLTGLSKVLPRARRWSSFFEAADFSPKDAAFPWQAGSYGITVAAGSMRESLRAHFQGSVETLPLDLDVPGLPAPLESGPFALIPAAVSRWADPLRDLKRLAEFLTARRELSAVIVGGWGDLSASQRKQGWTVLAGVMAQVRLVEAWNLNQLVAQAGRAQCLWLECFNTASWPHTVGLELARLLGKEAVSLSGPPTPRPEGSAANFLSRLYTQP